MKKIFLIALLFVSATVWAGEHEHHMETKAKANSEYANFTNEMNAGMEKMMKDMHSHSYSGDPDIDFILMMIPHHEGAIEMARLVLIYGTDPIVRKLAEDIIAAQRSEIETMKKRLEILRYRSDNSPDEFPALGGTRGK